MCFRRRYWGERRCRHVSGERVVEAEGREEFFSGGGKTVGVGGRGWAGGRKFLNRDRVEVRGRKEVCDRLW